MRCLIAGFLLKCVCFSQVLVSMDLLPSSGTSPEVGKGLNAFTWNIHACGMAAAKPVPFDLVRINFPEVRLYSNQQVNLILATRVAKSWQARTLNIVGYTSAGGGAVITLEEKLQKSPSWLGPIMMGGGLIIPLVQSALQKSVPNYTITNLPPNVIALSVNTCDDYTSLAPKGTAPTTLPSRRVDPLN